VKAAAVKFVPTTRKIEGQLFYQVAFERPCLLTTTASSRASIIIEGIANVGNSGIGCGLSRNVIDVPSIVATIVPD